MHSKFRFTLLPAGFALLAAVPAIAEVKTGVDAWTRGNYDGAIREWKTPADQGDPDALFNMGQAYKLGRGVPQDLRKAEEMFGRAAAQGHLQAADNYGLLLFQRGERARAMPFVKAAAERGDPRSQYLLGIAHFNGDNVAKDWIRAYALVSLAQQAGLPQAAPALAQMDQYVPLDQRQASVSLAGELASHAEATRNRQLAAVDLGSTVMGDSVLNARPAQTLPAQTPPTQPPVVTAQPRVNVPAPIENLGPRTAGADYARPQVPVAMAAPRPVATPVAPRPAAPVAVAARAISAPAASGVWRIQLGAFGQAANADAIWNRARVRPELAGRARIMVPAGAVTKLQAGGFASEAGARSACDQLVAGGFSCFLVKP